MDEVQRRGSASRLSYKKRFLAWLLCSVLVFGLMEPPPAKAVAIADDLLIAGGLSVIASVLISSGAQFRSQEDLMLVSRDVYDRYCSPGQAANEALMDIVRSWYDCGNKVIRGAVNISSRLWDLICRNPMTENVTGGYYGPWTNIEILTSEQAGSSEVSNLFSSVSSCRVNGVLYSASISNGILRTYINSVFHSEYSTYITQTKLAFRRFTSADGISFYRVCFLMYGNSYGGFPGELSFPISASFPIDSVPISGDVVRPGEDDRVIALPDVFPRVGDDGAVEMPVLSLDKTDYLVNKDVLTAAGTQEDVVVDAATGEKVDTGTGEQTDEKVGDIPLEDIKVQEQSLGAVFTSKFPFCIPWDLYKAVKLLAAPPKTPRWEVDFYGVVDGQYGIDWKGDTAIVIDFSEFELLGQVCRWTSTVGFVWVLMLGTKRLIWTS